MSGKIIICSYVKKKYPLYKLVYQLEGGRLYIPSGGKGNSILKVFLKNAYGWDFKKNKCISLESDFSENSIDKFFNSIRDRSGNSTLITYHSNDFPEGHCFDLVSKSLSFLNLECLEQNLEHIFKCFNMVCIWSLDNIPILYVRKNETFNSVVNEINFLGFDVDFVSSDEMPVW